MRPCGEVARAAVPGGGELVLTRRDDAWVITADGIELMTSREHGSEQALAELTLSGTTQRARSRVLIGGLGMGFTLRAALDRVGAQAEVVVAELVAEVAGWNSGPLADLAGHPLEDRRVSVEIADVRELVRRSAAAFDAILLDVDNGPDDILFERNRGLYDDAGLAAIGRALTPGGRLGIWSVARQAGALRQLRRAGFDAAEHRVTTRPNGRGGTRFIYVGRRR